ncbi:pyridoxal phosphate-dependent aminotransferase [Nocardia sienata]|uniref:pyridoxal phosphate-dependent aminotransferase n=1 Tax=Nocardia sienata TaxID=248552 RepID=UPI0007A40056|nr:pyridoxal phosphate-dependent aminotransferase [Nocardia sienata]
MTATQVDIVERFPELFYEARNRTQTELEEDFIGAFMGLAGEPMHQDFSRYMLSYSASSAITMVVSHCARAGKRVALIEPVFDNISSILLRENVDIVPLTEQDCTVERIPVALARLEPAVVWLVSPNNPTGWMLSEAEFRTLVQYCADRGCTLVLDTSFRFFCPAPADWSQYEILEESGVSYIVLEDTGKTWSTSEIKVGLAVCSQDMYADMYRLHDDLLQSVSPFHLRVLTEFIQDSSKNGFEESILPSVTKNRAILRSILSDGNIEFLTEMRSPVSVDWLRLPEGMDCEVFVHAAIQEGVHILPGTNFFWHQPERGRNLVRVALARDSQLMLEGAQLLRDTEIRLAEERLRR